LDHDGIIYSPFPFAVHCALEQSASGSWRLPLPPPGLFPKEREKEGEIARKKERKKE